MASADDVPPGDEGHTHGGSNMGAAPVNAKSPMHHHLRPVEGKGLKPIPLPPEGSIVIGRSARFGILDELVVAHHVECRVIYSPILAVSLSARQPVYVKDRLGVLKMLKAGKVGSLKQGEVLYLARRGTVPICGYIFTEGLPAKASRKGPEGSARESNAGDCIDLLDESSDEEIDARSKPDMAPPNARDEREAHTSDQGKDENGAGTRSDGKGTAEDPCELLSSDDDDVVVERAERKKKVKKKQTRAAHEKTSSRKRKQPPIRSKDQHAGAGASGAGPGFRWPPPPAPPPAPPPEPPLQAPPQPAPIHPDDTPAVKQCRASLYERWNDVLRSQALYRNLAAELHQIQAEYDRLLQSSQHIMMADFATQQNFNVNVNLLTTRIHRSIASVTAARAGVGAAVAQHKTASEAVEQAVSDMQRARRAEAAQRSGEASAKAFEEEKKAWDLVEKTTDLDTLSAGELRRIAKAMGVDIAGLLEKNEFVAAIVAKRDGGREAWTVRKRKRATEEAIAARQRKKLVELRQDESKREAQESSETKAKQHAVRQVAAWSRNADLKLFLQRCGIDVHGSGRTKKALQTAYRRAMMKYHPDRTRRASPEEQALAAEVTKWITQSWQNLRD